MVDEPFKSSAGARDELATAVARHFTNELGLKFALDRVELVPGAFARVEVVGSVREGSQLRQIVVAACPGEVKHPVVIFSRAGGRLRGARRRSFAPRSTAFAATPRRARHLADAGLGGARAGRLAADRVDGVLGRRKGRGRQ
ncbi:MAG: hypothetical protein IPJ65_32685 [Archangiaceae bacterium]|nr:hypothetical protein [Archangiaceae bacterium]